jgi:hypothetical protein
MEREDFGIEGVTAEDRAYYGSRFSEVREAIFTSPYQKVWGREGEPPLPHYTTTLSSILRGILSFGRPYIFRKAAERAVDSYADLRWPVAARRHSLWGSETLARGALSDPPKPSLPRRDFPQWQHLS